MSRLFSAAPIFATNGTFLHQTTHPPHFQKTTYHIKQGKKNTDASFCLLCHCLSICKNASISRMILTCLSCDTLPHTHTNITPLHCTIALSSLSMLTIGFLPQAIEMARSTLSKQRCQLWSICRKSIRTIRMAQSIPSRLCFRTCKTNSFTATSRSSYFGDET